MESVLPHKSRFVSLRPWIGCIFGLGLLALSVFYAGQAILTDSQKPIHLIVYAFSTQEETFAQGIFPAFERQLEAQTGRKLTIEGVFGPAETLAGQITLGAPADIAVFSNQQQVIWLQVGKALAQDAKPLVIGSTPLVIVTRPGNPFGIAGFADLSAANGLNLIHPAPNTSGAGEWALLAEYGSAYLETSQNSAAQAQLEAIWQQVRVLAPSARFALKLFELGMGDALITYEQDALLAAERGVPLEIVYPARTVLARPLAVVINQNVNRSEQEAITAFMDFLVSAQGQQIMARYHLRPADGEDNRFYPLVGPFGVEDLGGWSQAYTQGVEIFWQANIEPLLDLTPVPISLDSGD